MRVVAATQTLPDQHEATRDETTSQYSPLYNVVLLDDNAHTYAYVIEMLQTLIGCPQSWAYEMAKEVDTTGRVIVDSTTLEEAKLLQQKIHNYGADWRMPNSKGSMTAIVEPSMGL